MQDDEQTLRACGLTIVHTTDLRDGEHCAFTHAVALALRSKSKLVSIHANDDEAAHAHMPRAFELLARWGELPSDAAPDDEQKLGMRHECILDNCCDDPVDTLVRAVKNAQPQLVIGTTSGREGLARTMIGSVAEAIALHVGVPTLLMPVDCRPFVSEETGCVTLRRILVAAGDASAAQIGAQHALWLVDLLGACDVDIEVLHVEDGASVPVPSVADRAGVRLHVETARGGIEAALLQRAQTWQADVIVMATRGHDSLRDVLLGSHAERVLRRAPCAVLSVPIH
jgi:nucleotide-binding universal stress UspA family protein